MVLFLILIYQQTEDVCFVTVCCSYGGIKNKLQSFQCQLIIAFCFYKFQLHFVFLNGVGINLVVFSVCSNEPDEDPLFLKIEFCNQPKGVPFDIEYNPTVF